MKYNIESIYGDKEWHNTFWKWIYLQVVKNSSLEFKAQKRGSSTVSLIRKIILQIRDYQVELLSVSYLPQFSTIYFPLDSSDV